MIAREIIQLQEKLASERATYDSHCREVAEVLIPWQNNFERVTRPEGEKRSEKVMSTLAMEALNKFASAYDSITTPSSSRWHSLRARNNKLNSDQEINQYLDEVTDILFSKRYSSESNFPAQNHEVTISVGAFGTGVLMTEDVPGTQTIKYRSSHISEHYFLENNIGKIDVDYRRFKFTARQAVMNFKTGLPDKIIRAAEKTPHEKFEFIHCVRPNEERKPGAKDYRGAAFSSYYVSIEGQALLEESGFRTFPYHIDRYVTAPNEVYGRGPGMTALSEIKMLNAIRKSDLRARHMAIDPPILTSDDRALRRPLMKPGAVNYAALDANGNPLIKPYNNQARIDVSNDLIQMSHQIINEVFLVNLFQILVDSPSMTATEVLQKVQEKGSLLAPVAGRRQSEYLSGMIIRELDILSFSGALPPLPDALRADSGEIEIEFTAPINIMQRAGEAAATQSIVNDAIPLVQIAPDILDNFDFDEYLQIMRRARGAPAKLFKDKKEKDALRQAKQQQQGIASVLGAAPQVAGAIKDIAQAESYA